MDFSQYPASSVATRTEFFKKSDIVLKSVPNLVDTVWGAERPVRPVNPITVLKI